MKVYSHSLQGKREANEDQHVHILNLNGEDNNLNNINFFGVFDGHGGKYQQLYYKYPFKKNRVGGCSLRKKVLLKSSD
jgi:hypothetical protein